MKQTQMFMWILIPALGLLWWQGQQQANPQTTPSTTIPAAKIAVIDSGQFSSEQGIQQLIQQIKLLDGKYRPRYQNLQKLQQEVDALQREINTKAANWTFNTRQQKQEELQDKQIEAKREGEDLQRQYQRDLQRALAPINERVRAQLQQYASQRGITMILDIAPLSQAGAIPYLDQALDVTQGFISEYNKLYPAIQPSGSSSQ